MAGSPPGTAHQTSDHRTTRLDLSALDRAVDSYLDSGLAASTIRTYDAGIKHYSTFCEQLNTDHTCYGAAPMQICNLSSQH